MLSKTSPPDGDTFTSESGETIHIPGGVDIGWSSWGMQRSKTTFGADADIFRPERWLETGQTTEEKEKFALMEKLSELVFGYGKYQCLGKNVAV